MMLNHDILAIRSHYITITSHYMPLYTTIIPICPIYPNTSPLYPHIYILCIFKFIITIISPTSPLPSKIQLHGNGTSPSNSSMIFPTELPWLGHVDFYGCPIATLFLTEGLLLFVCLTTDVANDLMMPQLFQLGRD